MTVINLMAADQLLTATQAPPIAAGDIDTVQIQVDFDELWTAFAKSAVFHTNKKPEVYEMLLDEGGCCTVPAEVLAEECNLFIGVRGVDGARIKTTTLVKYKINTGAPCGNTTTIEPTPDMYQQMLTACGDAMESASEAKAAAAAAEAAAAEEVDKIIGDYILKSDISEIVVVSELPAYPKPSTMYVIV